MSQALQSLNSILKYRQERERQKIGESLSMLDMGVKLRQQRHDNKIQSRMMDLRLAQEKRALAKDQRDIDVSDVQLKQANLELEALQRAASPEEIALKKKEKELRISALETEGEVNKETLEEYKQKRSAEAQQKVSASLEVMYQERSKDIIEEWKTSGLIPSVVFQEVRTALSDGYDVDTDLNSVRDRVKERLGDGTLWDEPTTKHQLEYVKELLDKDKYGNLIIAGIAGAQLTEDKGIMNYEPLMQTLDELSSSMAHDTVLHEKMSKAGVNPQNLMAGLYLIQKNERNRESIEEAKRTGEFQSSLDRLAKEDVNIKIQELAKRFAMSTGLNYMTDYERQQLLEQGFSPEDLD